VPQAIEEGFFTQDDRFFPGMNRIGDNGATLNAGHVFNLNPLSIRSLSDGMVFGRKLALEYAEFYRKYVPGCADLELLTTAPVMGVRDSRRIVGEFELNIDDFPRQAPVPRPDRGVQPARPTCTPQTPARPSSTAS
jgi:hypothetical protein